MNNEILVSICCITYNHEKFIRQALDGFLMQKTNFKFEIIIHDDASTDSTQEIIHEYENKYPDIIKAIYQKENQYKKGIKASYITYQNAKGKYIAVCEGDDYWIDENKLQIQVDYMEQNPKCSFCFHNAKYLNMKNMDNTKVCIPFCKKQIRYIKKNNIYDVGELALLDQIPTASYLFKKVDFPEWYNNCIAGDLATQLICTSYGYAYYIDRIMSVYRIGTGQSITDKWIEDAKDYEKELERINKCIKLYEDINEYTKYAYSKEFEYLIDKLKAVIILTNPNAQVSKRDYKKLKRNLDFYIKIKLFIRVHLKKIYYKLKQLKQKS